MATPMQEAYAAMQSEPIQWVELQLPPINLHNAPSAQLVIATSAGQRTFPKDIPVVQTPSVLDTLAIGKPDPQDFLANRYRRLASMR